MNSRATRQPKNLKQRWRPIFSRRHRTYDAMLVFHLAMFNSTGWRMSIFDQRKIHENVT